MPGYGNQDGPKMESAKQEKYDLLHDNPVAKDASGGRPWIAKHFKSSMSPLNKECKKDACYHKVKSRVKVWPSAYASGQLVQCRKAGAANWGEKSKKK